MIKGVIDLGTNTFNLLIGEIRNGAIHKIHSEKIAVQLGMGGINRGVISEDAMRRAKDALRVFKGALKKNHVDKITGIGTSALRSASNADELVQFSKEELEIPIQIINGDLEAELIYKGVALLHDFNTETIIMDIGGGSSEFIFANQKGLIDKQSLDIGVYRIYQYLNFPDNFQDKEIESTIRFFEKKITKRLQNIKTNTLIGSSGSFETMYKLVFQQKVPKHQTSEVPIRQFMEIVDWAIHSPLQERMENPMISMFRKRMLPIAALQMKWMIQTKKIEKILISPYSLKEGALIS